VSAPLMEAEQDGSIRIQDLTKVVMARKSLGLAKERLVPFEATRDVPYANDRPSAFHRISVVGPKRVAEILTSNGSTRTLKRTTIAACVEMIRSRTRCSAMCRQSSAFQRIIRSGRFAPWSMRSWPTLSREFDRLYAATGRPSIPPERLLRAQLLQIFYSIRSDLLLIEQLDYNLLFRWFVGLGMDDEMDRFMKAFKEIFPQKSKTTAAG
jgi:Transposase domain (DUF772)